MVRILAFQARGPGSIPGRRSVSGGLAQSEERYVSNVQAPRSKLGFSILLRVIGAAIAQLGERQTEDLKVPGSIPGGGSYYFPTELLPGQDVTPQEHFKLIQGAVPL